MEWWAIFSFLLLGLIVLMLIGVPIAFAFFFINLLGAYFFMGGFEGIKQLTLNMYSTLGNFTLTPIPLFILMGEIIFRSGLAHNALNVFDRSFGKIPGRLGILAVATSTFFSGLTGSAISNTALLASSLLPEMRKRGYGKPLMIGPIVGTGGLAMMIPPSALAVVLGSVAHISISGILIGGILPALIMASLYSLYIMIRSLMEPSIAPDYETDRAGFVNIMKEFLIYVMPLCSVVILVLGPIYMGIATPTEAASLGSVGSIILALSYRKLTFDVLLEALRSTLKTSCMIFLIIAGSVGYSQIISFTGSGTGLITFITYLDLPEFVLIILMLSALLFLGCFMDQISMMMITIPLFMPIIFQANIDPLWFGLMMLIALDIGFTTPPFGLLLFVMKGIVSDDITMMDIYKAATPFILCNLATLGLILVFPRIVLFLIE
ncbi:MAG: TRAP transporter large permease [Syntrophorhabdaceae bacterium]|nr:TRAP transporter large permease [Syntrophorhabdaceae bacterium]MDD4195771.1 TRAP transporter large permease [Syntrophorhabdaceae bacterium]HOC45992.1 TRAP transporter large permease [Syntrophorhabdaceae bacterium]